MKEERLLTTPKHPVVRASSNRRRAADSEGRLVPEITGSTLPRAVIFRDSFVSPLVPFLSEHFSRAVYLWQKTSCPNR